MTDLQTITDAYLTCALWSSTDMDTEVPLDRDHDIRDLSAEAIQGALSDCAAFLQGCEADLLEFDEAGFGLDQAGHDFWLTRNGHGAGFWDRGVGAVGDRLSEMARPYGETYLYTGDDGQLYFG